MVVGMTPSGECGGNVANALYPHQVTAIEGIRASLRSGKRRPVLMSPTGSGKTLVAANIINAARAKGNRACFTVPLINLIPQTLQKFAENGIDYAEMGVIQSKHDLTRPWAPIQIASVQTLARRDWRPITEFVIVDEAHLCFEVIKEWMREEPNKIFIGLSASPWAKGMGDDWDDLVIGSTIGDLIRDGYLSPFRMFVPSQKVDLQGVKILAGDYHEGQLAERMGSKKIVADVVQTWRDHGENRPTLLFAVNRAHAQLLHDQFTAAGVTSAYVDANTPMEERDAIKERFHSSDIKVICSISTMGTGIDLDVRCIVHARPTRSEIRWVQDIGRGLRTAEGKSDLIVLDHGATAIRLGLPTDIYHDRLRTSMSDEEDKKKAAPEMPKPRECLQCHFIIPPKTLACPNCGWVAKRKSDVVCEDGELVEFGIARKASAGKRETVVERLRRYGRQAIYSQLWGLKGARADGWVAHKFKAIWDVFPPNGLDRVAKEPTPELESWVHAERIRWAKRRDRAA